MPVHHRQKKLHTLINDLCCSPALKLSCPSVFITVCVSNKQQTKKLRKRTRLISPSTRIFRKTSSLVRKQIQTKTTLKSFFFYSNFFLMPLHQLMRATDLENHMTPDTFAAFRWSSSWGLNNRGEPLSRVESWRRRDNLFRIMFRMRSFTRFTRGGDYFPAALRAGRLYACRLLSSFTSQNQLSPAVYLRNDCQPWKYPKLSPPLSLFWDIFEVFWCPAGFLGFSSLVPGTWSRCQRCMYKYKWIQIASRFDVSVLCFFFWRLLLSTFFTQISVLCTWIGKHAFVFKRYKFVWFLQVFFAKLLTNVLFIRVKVRTLPASFASQPWALWRPLPLWRLTDSTA